MPNPQYFVAVVGGAIAGSVAAEIFADRGIRVAVFEQNKRPYGKIEDGLPRWHREQRKQEYAHIDARLKKPAVDFIPCAKLGREIPFDELCNGWGFSAVVLANGAWRDRNLGVPGADEYIGKGLAYQNPFIYWYNHKNEKGYDGPHYETPDEAIVVGGGLASLDVVKALQFENYERAFAARGIHVDVHEMEKKGIPAVCKAHDLTPEKLGIKGCLLIYRRRAQDMPLAQPPEGATPDQVAKTEAVRQKLLHHAQEKYLFRFQERRLTQDVIIENGQIMGLKVAETSVEGRKAAAIPGSEHELRAPVVVSSIGSVPEVLPGVTMNGEYYAFTSRDIPRYEGSDHVFGVGNVVTGQGNIRVSMVHSQQVTIQLIERYLGLGDGEEDLRPIYAAAESKAAGAAQAVSDQVRTLTALNTGQIAAIEQRIREQQQRAGYTGDYDAWIAKVTPADME
jgi:ferredoxin/flavodoxin---NADP+ reductase